MGEASWCIQAHVFLCWNTYIGHYLVVVLPHSFKLSKQIDETKSAYRHIGRFFFFFKSKCFLQTTRFLFYVSSTTSVEIFKLFHCTILGSFAEVIHSIQYKICFHGQIEILIINRNQIVFYKTDSTCPQLPLWWFSSCFTVAFSDNLMLWCVCVCVCVCVSIFQDIQSSQKQPKSTGHFPLLCTSYQFIILPSTRLTLNCFDLSYTCMLSCCNNEDVDPRSG